MGERLKPAVLKTVEGVSPPGVRIPLFPFFISRPVETTLKGVVMRNSNLFLALTMALLMTACGQPSVTDATFDKMIEDVLADPNVPGVIVGVWAPAKGVEFVKAVGTADISANRAIKTTDKVRIASITKTFTTTIVLLLADEGLLSLGDTLGSFDLGVTIPKADQITIRMLANNTSGLIDYFTDPDFQNMLLADPTRKWTNKELVDYAMTKQTGSFTPGTVWGYSNTNFILMQMIVELLTGTTLGEEIQNRILTPLGMNNSSYPTDPAMTGEFARGYINTDQDQLTDITEMDPSSTAGAGALISTLDDLKIWAKALATGTLLKLQTQQERLQWITTGGSAGYPDLYGLGISSYFGLIGHTGGIFGYSSWMTYLPSQDTTIIFFTNGNSPTTISALGENIVHALYPDGKLE
jgi:D-alanyl-D-alanine carboxypeptidase